MAFDDIITADALEHIKALGATLHTYTPRGGSAVSRYVLIDRPTPQSYGGGLDNYSSYADAYICNDATNGVSSITVGGDKISVIPRLGQTAKTYIVAEIIEQDAGLWHLRLNVNG